MSDKFEQIPDNLPQFLSMLKEKNIDPSIYMIYIDRFLDDKARKQGVPLHGKFELTPLCNLDCKMCYVHLNKDQLLSEKIIPVSVWKSLAKEAVDMGMKQIELTGGECLTYPDFDELYLYLHSFGIEICVFTNGILLDEKRIEFFKKHPPKQIQITLYGESEDTYENVTGHRQFNRIISNIQKASENNLPVTIAVTPNRFMVGKGEEILKTVIKLGLPFKINYGLLDPRENTDRHGNEIEAPLDEYVKMLKLQAQVRKYEIKAVDEMSLPDIGSANEKQEYGMRCGAGRSGFSIDWKGKMHPCNSLYKISAYPLRDGFKVAWEDIKNQSKAFPRPIECTKCSYRDVCLPCAALHLQGAEPGHANPMICKRTKRMVKEGILKLD